MGPHLLYEERDGIAYVTLNRPEKRNALSPEMIVRLSETWRDVATDSDVSVALLTGSGDQSFCAGADLGKLVPLLTGDRPPDDEWDERLLADPRQVDRALLRDPNLFTPVVVAVNGHALGGGTELVGATDLRVASQSATFGLTEVRWGHVPAMGSLSRLPRQLSWAHAMEIILLGEPITAEHALDIGFLNRVVAPGEVFSVAEDFARRIQRNSPLAVAKAKEAMVRSSGLPLDQAFKIEDECGSFIMSSEDAKEGPRAFAEGREPVFVGR